MLAAPGASSAGPAVQAHDGSWALEVLTERGDCEPLYRYYVVIEGQVVRLRSPFGETSEGAQGVVRADGRVDATLGNADDPVSVKGRLGASSGGGTWSAPARRCTGRWSAQKRA